MPHADPIVRLNAALRGRYRIDRELGVGGMATVYLADDLRHELYLSNESGSTGLYVRRLSDATGQVAVPSGGRRVSLPRWSTDGSAVLWMDFDSGEPELLRSRVRNAGGGRTFAPPEGMLLVEGAARSAASLRARNWDVSPDGERFVFVVDRDPESASRSGPRAEIVVNWFTELRALSGN